MAAGIAETESAHFHHFHLNVMDPSATRKFYTDFLGAMAVRYRGVADALFTERSFILFTKVDTPAPAAPESTLHHMGWSGVDGPSLYEWLKGNGVRYHTPATPLGPDHYQYFYGPDDEILEIYTGAKNHRFNHFHLYSTDVLEAAQWFVDHLGLQADLGGFMPVIQVDNVTMVLFGKYEGQTPEYWLVEKDTDFEPTEGRVIDHIAFSYRDIDPVYERMGKSGLEIVRPIVKSAEFGHRSFYIRAPDNLLVEIVEDKPIPEGIWD